MAESRFRICDQACHIGHQKSGAGEPEHPERHDAAERFVCGLNAHPMRREFALEIAPLRAMLPPETVLVTPGIRSREAKADDQTRVMTPALPARKVV